MQLPPVVVLVALTGCRQVLGIEDPTVVASDAPTNDAAALDAAVDGALAMDADAAVLGAWGAPMRVFADASTDDDPSLTADLLELYFDRFSTIYVSTRTSAAASWPTPTIVAEIDTAGEQETTPAVSPDGLTLVYATTRSPTQGGYDIWQATRATRQSAWGPPAPVPALSSSMDDIFGGLSEDGLAAVMVRRPLSGGSFSLYRATRATTTTAWSAPTAITALNVGPVSKSPVLAGPGSSLYFDSNRGGDFDLYVAELSGGAYVGATLVPGLASPSSDEDPWVSSDQRTMYFSSTRDGGTNQLFWTTR